jgi:hypothetical protein
LLRTAQDVWIVMNHSSEHGLAVGSVLDCIEDVLVPELVKVIASL